MTQHCSDCGKEFKNGARAIAIAQGNIDYPNYEGFRSDDDPWLYIYCKKCWDKKNSLLQKLVAILKEFTEDVERAYTFEVISNVICHMTDLELDWYDLSVTYDKAKKLIKNIK